MKLTVETHESGLRTVLVALPEPMSVNVYMRLTHRARNMKRHVLVKKIREKLPHNHEPLRFVIVDATLNLFSLRDEIELGFSLKTEMDAFQEAKLIFSDGPEFCSLGTISQRINRGHRGALVTITEISPPKKKRRVK